MKFTIRDLLLVTVIVAVALAWWLDRSRLLAKVQDLEFVRSVDKSRADSLALLVKVQAQAAEAQADYARARAAWDKVLQSRPATEGDEGQVRGYNLLGPPLPNPNP